MKLNTFDDTNSPMCSKCVTELGTFMHLFWYCKAVYSFWEKIHKAIQDMCNCTLELCPMLYLLNYGSKKIPYTKKCVFTMLYYFAKKIILAAWISQSGPTMGQWLEQIIDLLPIEEITSKQHSRIQEFISTWSLVLNYIAIIKNTNQN